MDLSEGFGADYADCRRMFVAAANERGGLLETYSHPDKGPGGEDLSTDTAWFGPTDAENVVVCMSGTHGVEGFCGSGVQVNWLRSSAVELPRDTALYMIHALNPYGFAWLRRVNEDNIDINRNWVDFSVPLRKNEAYADLYPIYCPKEWSEEARDALGRVSAEYAEKHGRRALQNAISTGQHDFPNGVFFAGTKPCWSRVLLTKLLTEKLKDVANIAILDFHSGLGPEGYCEKIVTASNQSSEFARARDWFGRQLTSLGSEEAVSAKVSGDGLSAMPSLLPHANVTPIAMEYGTRPREFIVAAMCADNWLHAHGDPTGPEAKPIKQELLDAFYVDTPEWRGMVYGQGYQAIRQALEGVSAS